MLAELGRAPVGADLDDHVDGPGRRRASRRARRSRSRARSRSATSAGFALARTDLALAAQRAEHVATGVPCGIQDQMASVHGRAGHAIFLDCRTLEIEHVPLPPTLRVLVVHSGVPRTLEGTPYAQRRAESEAVADHARARACCATRRFEQVRDIPRGRHAVTEMARVRAVRARRCATDDLDALGPLMLASHASSRDDMEVSIPELDTLVECLVDAGALGARLTGAGFGGCVVALGAGRGAPTTIAAAAQRERYRDAHRARTDGVGRARRGRRAGADADRDRRATRRRARRPPALRPRARNEPCELRRARSRGPARRWRSGRARSGRSR